MSLLTEEPVYKLKPVEFDPFAGPELLLIAPATEPQIEIWLSCKIGGVEASCAFNESFSLTLTGSFNVAAFENAVHSLIDRHESLRALFSPDGTRMCIYRYLQPAYHFEDISGKDEKGQEQAIKDYLYRNSQTAFDLVFGPLFRVKLFKRTAERHHLTLTLHHIICDGWSFGVILQELGNLYSAHAMGLTPNLPPAPKFSSYAAEQVDFQESATYADAEKFWLEQYQTRPPVLNLPSDQERPSLRTYTSGHYHSSIDETLAAAVKKLGFAAGASVLTTLLAAFEVFMQQQTGCNDVVVGVPSAGQPAIGLQGLVGHCVNLLPIRSFEPDDICFIDYLKRRRGEILDVYDHQLITFGGLLKKLNLPRDPSRVPLVPVVFNSDMGMDSGISFHGIKHELKSNARRSENFEIFINLNDIGKGLNIEWSYNAQLFNQAGIEKLATNFEVLLRTFTTDPRAHIKTSGLPAEPVKIDTITQWNKTETWYPKEKPLHTLISEIAAKYDDKPAVVAGSVRISYRQLDERSNQLTRLLVDRGISKGDIVGLAVERSVEMIITLLAIMKAGGTYVPIDPEYPADRIAYMLEDSSAKMLIVSERIQEQINSPAQVLTLESALKQSASKMSTPVEVDVKGTDIAYVLYTSGSTGKPKGVQIAHYNLVNFLVGMQAQPGIAADDKLLAVTTISFDIAGLEMYLPLVTGATVYIASADEARDGRRLLEIVKAEGITLMQATPYSWKMMLEAGWDNRLQLKALCGGEPLPKELAARLLPKCKALWNMYGPTETTIWSTVKEITLEDGDITIGKPIANTQVYILDEKLNILPAGVTGEIFIAGDGVSPGYLHRPELTADRFVIDPFTATTGSKMYRTGDLGKYLPNGELLCLGRVDFQVKIRGYRIEVQEIEHNLHQINEIKDAVVDARKDASGNLALVAYVVSQQFLPDTRTAIQNWRNALRENLPEYMVPQYFMVVEEFPLTPNGKINRKALPEPDHNQARMAYAAPRTSIEQLVADIWRRYLGIEKIGIYDDFFELGGHSLIAVEIMTALQKETGKNLPLASLFQHSTIEQLALLLKIDGKSVSWDSLVPIKPVGSKMPLYIVHGAGLNVLLFNTLAMNMDSDQPVYGLQARGLNGIDEPYDKMEDIAGHYVNEIIAQNPNGPYALAGYSFGGIIAYEMAKQLEARGKQVKLLAMFDTYAYRSDYYDLWLKKYFNRIRFFIMQILHSFVLLAKSPKRTIEYKSEMIRRRIVTFKRKFQGADGPKEGFSGYSHKIDEANELAERNYKLAPYPIRVELFRAQKITFYMDDFENLGWKPYALKGVSIHEIPGEHNYIFAPPNDKAFARILQDCLNKASSATA
ncbi:amino acid adenylation domain-containing protein [Mucilaginibacter yixingensis]|uniref:Amino acid adenylation domain-containing protein n=1 Tax=Mucilaginibacter yixingensis TaxID=1295612 RepID=A0A2T5J9N1_9SPHI|nr:non-ribosomal peptide synthetase [Mucilaginibacter yixingensis]PTQ96709.1 amino acid adenylation domain-containing protein [Mucilaginibacter yixingensis]